MRLPRPTWPYGWSPSRRSVTADSGQFSHLARQYDKTVVLENQALDLNPDAYGAHVVLGLAKVPQRKLPGACAEFERAVALVRMPWTLGYLGYAYGLSGRRREALVVLEELKRLSNYGYVSPITFALVYTGMDQKHEALTALERAVDDRNEMLSQVRISPEFDDLRSDSRCEAILGRCRSQSAFRLLAD